MCGKHVAGNWDINGLGRSFSSRRVTERASVARRHRTQKSYHEWQYIIFVYGISWLNIWMAKIRMKTTRRWRNKSKHLIKGTETIVLIEILISYFFSFCLLAKKNRVEKLLWHMAEGAGHGASRCKFRVASSKSAPKQQTKKKSRKTLISVARGELVAICTDRVWSLESRVDGNGKPF